MYLFSLSLKKLGECEAQKPKEPFSAQKQTRAPAFSPGEEQNGTSLWVLEGIIKFQWELWKAALFFKTTD